MNCFYHPTTDAVGFCSQCGKAACRDCIEDIRGTMLCKGCIVRTLQEQTARQDAVKESRQDIIDAARRRIRVSKFFFIVPAIFGLLVGIGSAVTSVNDPNAPPFVAMIFGVPLGALFAGYLFWACFWGIPAIWKGWWGGFKKMGCFLIANPITWLLLIVAFFEIPLFVGYMYGIFGGGYYEYTKCARIAKMTA